MAAEKVLIQGESGTGKTFSLKDLSAETTAIVSPEKTRLPFRNQFKMLVGETDSKKIIKFIDECVKEGKKSIIVDDFQYVLAIPYMNRIHESGWDKYNDFGGNYFDIIDHCKKLPDDVIVYFMTHTETLDDGVTRTKLIGKLLREKITIEGLFTIVLRTMIVDGKYYFATQNNGKDTTKTPFGMFDTFAIENNLAYVDAKIRNYYYMDGAKSDEEMKAADEQASAPEVEKPTEGRKSRRSRAKEEADDIADIQKKIDEAGETPKPRRSRASRKAGEAEEYITKSLDVVDEIADGRDEVPFDEVVDAIEEVYIKTEDGNFKKVMSNEVTETDTIITREEFIEGGKAIAQQTAEAPRRRTRRTRA